MNHKLRILISTNIPFSYSGYASTAREIMYKIRDEGYALAFSNFFGQEGYVKEIDGIMHYPKMNNLYGDDAMLHHSRDFKADIIITNQDTFVLNPAVLQQLVRWVPWVPIDHDPVTPTVVERMKNAYRIIPCSKFGDEQLRNFGFRGTYIPYSVDTEVFKPMDKKEIRKKYLPDVPEDAFVFGVVAENKSYPPRKSHQEILEAFKIVFSKHPNVYLFLNTPMGDPGGFPIVEYAKYLKVADRLFYTNNYNIFSKSTNKDVAEVINAFDVSLCPSATEGFGLNIVEAQACGIPVIVNDFVSMPELIKDGETGWKCKVGKKRYTPQMSFVGEPDVQDLAAKMELSMTADRAKMGEAGRKWVQENYDSKAVFEKHWKPFLQKIENEIYPQEKA